MNTSSKSSHNANLPVTIASNGRIVNPIFAGVAEESYDDCIIEQATESVYDNWDNLTRENQASVLFKLLFFQLSNYHHSTITVTIALLQLTVFGIDWCEKNEKKVIYVKVSNNIFKHNLKPKVIELYIVISYIIMVQPNFRFSYRSLAAEYTKLTNRIINKDTVAKYINILINKNLLKKGKNKNYLIGTNLYDPNTVINLDSNNNHYLIPVNNYTPFYIKIYLDKLTKNEVILDHYIATLCYKNLRPSKVTREVNISLSTYFNLLRSLRQKSILYRNTLFYNKIKYKKLHYYYGIKRNHLKKDYEDDKILRYYDNREKVLESINKPKPHPSRYWFTGAMGEYMKRYKIKYIKMFNNYDVQDALAIIKELEQQKNIRLCAPMIVKAIKEGWNWDKIVARRHKVFKKML